VAEEEVAEEEAPTFSAATYTNEEYGFSISYPDDWIDAGSAGGTTLWAYKSAAGVPSASISRTPTDDENYTEDYKEMLVAGLESLGGFDIEIVSEGTGELSDGTATVEYKTNWVYFGYDLETLSVVFKMEDGAWFAFSVTGCEALGGPYDEALYKAIIYTLEFD
jgi:hypothetical protein